MSISVLVRLLVVMLTFPPLPEFFSPTENVLIVSFPVFSSPGGLIFFAFSVISPPFPEVEE